MITNILIGIGSFLIGGFVGSIIAMNLVMKVNKLYKEETGNDFLSWVYDASNEKRKARLEKYYAED